MRSVVRLGKWNFFSLEVLPGPREDLEVSPVPHNSPDVSQGPCNDLKVSPCLCDDDDALKMVNKIHRARAIV